MTLTFDTLPNSVITTLRIVFGMTTVDSWELQSTTSNDEAKFSDAKQCKALFPTGSTPPVKPVRPLESIPKAKPSMWQWAVGMTPAPHSQDS